MEQILERVQKVVADYNPGKEGGRVRTIRALLPAVVAVRKFIDENSQEDRGCAQRIARELDDVLAALPDFQTFSDKQGQAARHTRRLAEEHLDDIENYLKRIVAEDDAGKKKLIHEWIKTHPVFGELKKTVTAKSLPKRAYVLLFKKSGDGGVELLTRKTPDNAVISRLRPHEFFDDFRVNKAYSRMDIAGAAVISEQQLIGVMGQVPVPRDKQTQLQALLSVSKEAVGRPAQEFIEENRVLKQLYDLARRRKMPKDAYVLLFQQTDEEGDDIFVADIYEPPVKVAAQAAGRQSRPRNGDAANETLHADAESDAPEIENVEGEDSHGELSSVDEVTTDEVVASSDDSSEMPSDVLAPPDVSDDSAEEILAGHDPDSDDAAHADENGDVGEADIDEHEESESSDYQDNPESSDEHDDDGAEADESDESTEGEDHDSVDESDEATEGDDHDSVDESEVAAPSTAVAANGPVNVRIVVRKTSDGKVITRFWSADFAVKHKLFDEFKEKPPVVGAAIVKRTELVRVLGRVPVSAGSQSRFDAVMQASRLAVEKPSIEFVAEHEVLRGLHELANKDTTHRDACVIMFVVTESGRVEAASGEPVGAVTPLFEFRSAKVVHDKFFAKANVVGASVIAPGVGKPPQERDRERSNNDNRGNDRGKGRNDGPRRDSTAPKPSVIAAFGRTPLKVNLLASPENFSRLGINVDATRLFEVERVFRPGTRPMKGGGGKPQGRRDGRVGPHDNRPGRDSRGPRDRGPREQGGGQREQGSGQRDNRAPREPRPPREPREAQQTPESQEQREPQES